MRATAILVALVAATVLTAAMAFQEASLRAQGALAAAIAIAHAALP